MVTTEAANLFPVASLDSAAFNSNDGKIYVTDGSVATWYVVDPATMTIEGSFVPSSSIPVNDFAHDPVTNLFWGGSGSTLYSMDTAGNVNSYPGAIPTQAGDSGAWGAAFADQLGNVAIINNNSGRIYSIDTTNQTASFLANAQTGQSGNDAAASSVMSNDLFKAHLALDPDSSTGGNGFDAYQQYDAIADTPVSIADTDIQVTDLAGHGISGAQIALRDPKGGDELNVGTLPAGITASTQTVNGQIIVTLTGNGTAAEYEAAIAAITFENTAPGTADNYPRTIDVSITNGQGAVSSATSKIFVVGGTVGSLPDQTADGATDDQAVTTEEQTVIVNLIKKRQRRARIDHEHQWATFQSGNDH